MIAYQAAFDFDPWLRQHEFGIPPSALNEGASRRRALAGFEVERLLKQLGWTMSAISLQTRMRFGEDTPYFVPRTFRYKGKTGITPHICQVVALSRITGHSFADWMRVYGFDLALILQLQLKVANERTTMLVQECDFETIPDETTENRHVGRYCYAKIGSRDAVLYPAVHPGTIVRADRYYSREILNADTSVENMWLVEHPNGITCCRIKVVGKSELVLLPHYPPLSCWPLRFPTQARILGLIDAQLQPFEVSDFRRFAGVPKTNKRIPSSKITGKLTLSKLLRQSRHRTGLTFREAHKTTLRIAEIMSDRAFAISTGLLSDYEAMDKLPRHIAKIVSLCVTYGIEFYELLHAAGVETHSPKKRNSFTAKTLSGKRFVA